jgi:hypothetical protein
MKNFLTALALALTLAGCEPFRQIAFHDQQLVLEAMFRATYNADTVELRRRTGSTDFADRMLRFYQAEPEFFQSRVEITGGRMFIPGERRVRFCLIGPSHEEDVMVFFVKSGDTWQVTQIDLVDRNGQPVDWTGHRCDGA